MTTDEPGVGWAIHYENPVTGRDKQIGHTWEVSLMSLELLVHAIKSRTPISFEYNKADKTPGLRIGNAHAAFIMRRKDGTESTKVDIVQTAGVSDTDPPVFPEWRMFDLTEISNIVLREQEAPFPIDPGYKPDTLH